MADDWGVKYRELLERLGSSAEQAAIVRDIFDGYGTTRVPLRDLACAGSGKTFTMVAAVAYLLARKADPSLPPRDRMDPRDVVVTTFTKKAATEIAERLTAVTRPGLIGGGRGVRVSTYHSLGLVALRQAQRHPAARREHGWDGRRMVGGSSTKDAPSALPYQIRDEDALWEGIVAAGQLPGMEAVPPVREYFRDRVYYTEGAGTLRAGDTVRSARGATCEVAYVQDVGDSGWFLAREIDVSRGPLVGRLKSSSGWTGSTVGLIPGQELILDPGEVHQTVGVLRSHACKTPEEATARGLVDAEPSQEMQGILYAWRFYNRLKQIHNAWDFDDVLAAHLDLIRAGGDRAKLVIVDEAQDNTEIQMLIARGLAQNHPQGRAVYVGDVRQCQPGSTLVRTAGREETRLQDLRTGDEVVAWDRKGSHVFSRKTFPVEVARRAYEGPMAHVMAGGCATECTPNHRWLVRWDPALAKDLSCVYVMRRGHSYRLGWCKVIDETGGLCAKHYATRARIEGADALWIIEVFRDRGDASIRESELSAQYGIPTLPFKSPRNATLYTQDRLDRAWGNLSEHSERGFRSLLSNYTQLSQEFPLWTAGGSPGCQTVFEVVAGNLVAGMMVPVDNRDGTYRWEPVDIRWEQFDGDVYSLDVAEHHSYVADGLCTLNSIYAFRGAQPEILGNADKTEGATTLELTVNYRSGQRIVAAGNAVAAGQSWAVGSPSRAARSDLGEVQYIRAGDLVERAERVARDVAARIEAGASPRDFAVLSRTKAAMGPFEIMFLIHKIPAVIQGGSPFFQTKPIERTMSFARLGMGHEAQAPESAFWDFMSAMKALGIVAKEDRFKQAWDEINRSRGASFYAKAETWYHREHERRYGDRVLLWGRDAETREERFEQGFLGSLEIVERHVADEKAGNLVKELSEHLSKLGVISLPKGSLQDEPVPNEGAELTEPNKEEGETAVEGEGGSDRDMITMLARIGSMLDPKGLVGISIRMQALDKILGQTPWAHRKAVKAADEGVKDRVIVGTIHSSKGLEWPVVYLLTGAKELPHKGEDSPEERRLFYVGVTRARDALYLAAEGGESEYVMLVREELQEKAEKAITAIEPVADPQPEPDAIPLPVSVDETEITVEDGSSDLLLEDYLALRRLFEQHHPDLVPAFDSMREAVLRHMASIRAEYDARHREQPDDALRFTDDNPDSEDTRVATVGVGSGLYEYLLRYEVEPFEGDGGLPAARRALMESLLNADPVGEDNTAYLVSFGPIGWPDFVAAVYNDVDFALADGMLAEKADAVKYFGAVESAEDREAHAQAVRELLEAQRARVELELLRRMVPEGAPFPGKTEIDVREVEGPTQTEPERTRGRSAPLPENLSTVAEDLLRALQADVRVRPGVPVSHDQARHQYQRFIGKKPPTGPDWMALLGAGAARNFWDYSTVEIILPGPVPTPGLHPEAAPGLDTRVLGATYNGPWEFPQGVVAYWEDELVGTVGQHPMRSLYVKVRAYAQYPRALHVTYVPKGARKPREVYLPPQRFFAVCPEAEGAAPTPEPGSSPEQFQPKLQGHSVWLWENGRFGLWLPEGYPKGWSQTGVDAWEGPEGRVTIAEGGVWFQTPGGGVPESSQQSAAAHGFSGRAALERIVAATIGWLAKRRAPEPTPAPTSELTHQGPEEAETRADPYEVARRYLEQIVEVEPLPSHTRATSGLKTVEAVDQAIGYALATASGAVESNSPGLDKTMANLARWLEALRRRRAELGGSPPPEAPPRTPGPTHGPSGPSAPPVEPAEGPGRRGSVKSSGALSYEALRLLEHLASDEMHRGDSPVGNPLDYAEFADDHYVPEDRDQFVTGFNELLRGELIGAEGRGPNRVLWLTEAGLRALRAAEQAAPVHPEPSPPPEPEDAKRFARQVVYAPDLATRFTPMPSGQSCLVQVTTPRPFKEGQEVQRHALDERLEKMLRGSYTPGDLRNALSEIRTESFFPQHPAAGSEDQWEKDYPDPARAVAHLMAASTERDRAVRDRHVRSAQEAIQRWHPAGGWEIHGAVLDLSTPPRMLIGTPVVCRSADQVTVSRVGPGGELVHSRGISKAHYASLDSPEARERIQSAIMWATLAVQPRVPHAVTQYPRLFLLYLITGGQPFDIDGSSLVSIRGSRIRNATTWKSLLDYGGHGTLQRVGDLYHWRTGAASDDKS